MFDRVRVLDESWVVVVHSIYVCPYLYLGSSYRCSDERCTVVGSATLQIVHFAICVAADKSLCDIDVLIRCLLELFLKTLADVFKVRLAVLVCAHKLKCWDERCIVSLFNQIVCHHVCGYDFPLSHDYFLFKHSEDAFCERTQVVELFLQKCESLLFHLVCGVELVNVLLVFLFKSIDGLVGPFWIFLVEIVGYFHKRVCCSRHG